MSVPFAILLDLDDTILDSGDADAAWRTISETEATRLPGVTPETLFAAFRAADNWYWGDADRARAGRFAPIRARQTILRRAYGCLGIEDSSRITAMATQFERLRDDMLRPFPGVLDMLRRLREVPVRTALISNGGKDLQWGKINRFALAQFFDHIQVEQEFGIGKPDACAFRHALTCLDVTPADAWMVGDNLDNDIRGAQQVGIHAIWIDGLGKGLPANCRVKPDRIIATLSALFD